VAPDDATRTLGGLHRPQPCLIDARSRGCDDAAPPTPNSLPVDASARGGDGKLLSPVPLISPAHGARPNGSEFCCRTLTRASEPRELPSASADSSNSLLDGTRFQTERDKAWRRKERFHPRYEFTPRSFSDGGGSGLSGQSKISDVYDMEPTLQPSSVSTKVKASTPQWLHSPLTQKS